MLSQIQSGFLGNFCGIDSADRGFTIIQICTKTEICLYKVPQESENSKETACSMSYSK